MAERDLYKETSGSSAQHKKKKKKASPKKRIARIIIALVIAFVLLFVFKFFGGAIGGDEKTRSMLEGYTTIAFFGVDNRSTGDYAAGNSDTIMLCNIKNDTQEVEFVSIYRDTLMDVDGDQTFRKCNYAYNHGGVEEAVAMLNRNLDLEIEDYVAVDFLALVDAVDAVGGIDIELTDAEADAMNGGYIGEVAAICGKDANNVSAGVQHLDGVQATAYCRIRSTAGDDFRRTERQRTVVSLLVDAAKAASATEQASLIASVFPSIDTSLEMEQLIFLAKNMTSYNLGQTQGFPTDLTTDSFSDLGDCIVPCSLASNVTTLHQQLYNDLSYTPSETVQSISDALENYTGYGEGDGTY